MNTLKKEFSYRTYKCNIKIDLNTKVQRFNGNVWHTVTINCLVGTDTYYKKEEVNDRDIETFIENCEKLAKAYIDEKLDGIRKINQRLSDLGFS